MAEQEWTVVRRRRLNTSNVSVPRPIPSSSVPDLFHFQTNHVNLPHNKYLEFHERRFG
jgi:hypothetical protein